MADQASIITTLYKKYKGYVNTENNTSLESEYFINAFPYIYENKVYTDSIPTTAPDLSSARYSLSGATSISNDYYQLPLTSTLKYIKKYVNVLLRSYKGNPRVFVYSDETTSSVINILKNAIYSTYDAGSSYGIIIKTSDGILVPPDYYTFDYDAGIIRIYGDYNVSVANPPRITFWRYEGTIGGLLSKNDPRVGAILTPPSKIGEYIYADADPNGQFDAVWKIGTNSVILGRKADSAQGPNAISIGHGASSSTSGFNTISIGAHVSSCNANLMDGQVGQQTSAISIGTRAGKRSQAPKAISIGMDAGNTSQGINSIAIGWEAGSNMQGSNSIAIGLKAGSFAMGANSIAIGSNVNTPGSGSIILGQGFKSHLGSNIIFIGNGRDCNIYATNLTNSMIFGDLSNINITARDICNNLSLRNSIVFTTQGNFTIPNAGLYIDNIRNQSNNLSQALYYNSTTREITFSDICGGGGNIGQWASCNAIQTLNMSGNIITNLSMGAGTPGASNAVNVGYLSSYLRLSNSTAQDISSTINFRTNANLCNNRLINIGDPSDISDAVNLRALSNWARYAATRDISMNSRGIFDLSCISYADYSNNSSKASFNSNAPNIKFLVDYVSNNGGNRTGGVGIGTSCNTMLHGQYIYYDGSGGSGSWQAGGSNTIQIGRDAGRNAINRGGSIAMGIDAARSNQGTYSIAIGGQAGDISQNAEAIAIGKFAGSNNQGKYAFALGNQAGQISQGEYTIAIGQAAGQTSQLSNAIAIGNEAGKTSQGVASIAIGNLAGQSNQKNNSIVINATGSNLSGDLSNALFIKPIRPGASLSNTILFYDASSGHITYSTAPQSGATPEQLSQYLPLSGGTMTGPINMNRVALSNLRGPVDISDAATKGYIDGRLPLGNTFGSYLYYDLSANANAGGWASGSSNIRMGMNAGRFNQKTGGIAIGSNAGASNQQTGGIAIGNGAADISQSEWAIAIGNVAGQTNQGSGSIAIGLYAGFSNQKASAIAIGSLAGVSNQLNNAIAIGENSGRYNQNTNAIAIGNMAGQYTQNINTIAIGSNAGNQNQGSCSIAIGNRAGETNQFANSIILNAQSNIELSADASGFYVAPIRQMKQNKMLYYNETRKEITYGDISGDGSGVILETATTQGSYLYYNGTSCNWLANPIRLGQGAGGNGSTATIGTNSIAIGKNASLTGGSFSNTIVLNAQDTALNPAQASSFYVKPVRSNNTLNSNMKLMYYDSNAGELTYNTEGINVQNNSSGTIQLLNIDNRTGGATATLLNGNIQNGSGAYEMHIGGDMLNSNNQRGGIRFTKTTETTQYIQPFTSRTGGSSANLHFSKYQRTITQCNVGVAFDLSAGRYGFNTETMSNTLDISGTLGVSRAIYAKGLGSTSASVTSNMLYYDASTGEIKQGPLLAVPATLPGATIFGSYVYYNGSAWVKGDSNITLGSNAGQSNQGSNSVAIGGTSGQTNQGSHSVAIGFQAGQQMQGSNAIAIGRNVGYSNQQQEAIAIGNGAGFNTQGQFSVGIGREAGNITQGELSVALGAYAGQSNQESFSVAIGAGAGRSKQDTYSVAIGYDAGASSQLNNSVAVGYSSGAYKQGMYAVAIGDTAAFDTQQNGAVAIGASAGERSQATNAIAIGPNAGRYNQAENSIAIGSLAGYSNQHPNTIVMNAGPNQLNSVDSNGTYINPIRRRATNTFSKQLYWDRITGEIFIEP